jgi:transcriptional regulator with XRE-family HTH domain
MSLPRKDQPIVLPEFGKYLQILRLQSGFGSQEAIVKAIFKKLGVRVAQSRLAHYEVGRVLDPDRAVLQALSELYGVPYTKVCAELVKEKYGLTEEHSDNSTSSIVIENSGGKVHITLAGDVDKVMNALRRPLKRRKK